MKKMALLSAMLYVAITSSYAQGYYVPDPNAVAGATYEDANQHVGIGTFTSLRAKLNVVNTNASPYAVCEVTARDKLGMPINNLLVDRNINLAASGPPQYVYETDFVVKSSGKVGVGIYDPTAKFHVKSSANNGYPTLQVDDAGGSYPFVVLYNGYTGIGTVAPTSMLEVNGDALFDKNVHIIKDATIDGNEIVTGTSEVDGVGTFYDDVDIFGTLGVRSLVAGTGLILNNFGVDGNTSLGGTLQVHGAGAFDDNVSIGHTLSVHDEATVGNTLAVGGITNQGALHLYSTSLGAYAYANLTDVSNSNTKALAVVQTVSGTGTDKFVVYGDGRTVIGGQAPATTTYSDYKLAVNGNIAARKVMVEISDWQDKVFEKSYTLPTLKSVEAYVNTNKHLPDVPSECEVLQNGISVGDMNATLLKKIEELTLYMIQQQKEIEVLKAKK